MPSGARRGSAPKASPRPAGLAQLKVDVGVIDEQPDNELLPTIVQPQMNSSTMVKLMMTDAAGKRQPQWSDPTAAAAAAATATQEKSRSAGSPRSRGSASPRAKHNLSALSSSQRGGGGGGGGGASSTQQLRKPIHHRGVSEPGPSLPPSSSATSSLDSMPETPRTAMNVVAQRRSRELLLSIQKNSLPRVRMIVGEPSMGKDSKQLQLLRSLTAAQSAIARRAPREQLVWTRESPCVCKDLPPSSFFDEMSRRQNSDEITGEWQKSMPALVMMIAPSGKVVSCMREPEDYLGVSRDWLSRVHFSRWFEEKERLYKLVRYRLQMINTHLHMCMHTHSQHTHLTCRPHLSLPH
jgi:hypothetical protein